VTAIAQGVRGNPGGESRDRWGQAATGRRAWGGSDLLL